jgi:hypothetical protein
VLVGGGDRHGIVHARNFELSSGHLLDHAIANLAPAVLAPADDLARVEQRACVRATGRDRDRAADAGDLVRLCERHRRTASALPEGIVAPAPDLAAVRERASVLLASSDRSDTLEVQHGDRHPRGHVRAITQHSRAVRAPATHRVVDQ